jgi:hypothetical protein
MKMFGLCTISRLNTIVNETGPPSLHPWRSRIHFEDSRFNISLVTATSTRIQSEDVLHEAHVIDEM